MRLLIDEALQDAVAHRLAEEDHDTSHVRALGLAGRTDDEVMERALVEEPILVTTDPDFGTILALTGAAGPSVLVLRGIGDSTPERVAALLTVLPRVNDGTGCESCAVGESDSVAHIHGGGAHRRIARAGVGLQNRLKHPAMRRSSLLNRCGHPPDSS